MAQKLNTRTSIVDYLKSQGQDSSMSARKKLAQQHGIKNYSGTYNQNVTLLSKLRSGSNTTQQKATSKPKATTAKSTPKTTTTKPKATTTTTTAKSTPKVQPTSSQTKQQEAQKSIDKAKKEYADFLKQNKESFTKEQTALLDKAKAERLAELEKAYNEAVRQGEMSKEEADRQLEEMQEMINEDAYRNSQITELSGEMRGVQNSQQLLAMQQGDQRHTASLRSDAQTERDRRINEIQSRLDQITNNYNLDQATVNAAYNSDLIAMQERANQQYVQGMQQLTLAEFKSQLEAKQQLSLMEQQQLDALQRMEVQHGYDLTKMDLQHNYQLEQMEAQHGFNLESLDVQQRHALEIMAKQHGYDLSKMDIQQGYELQRMSVAHSYDVNILERQFANNVSLAELQYSHQMNMSEIEFKQAKQLAEHNANLEKEAEERRYKDAVERELAKYQPGTLEYQIRKGQLDAEHERIMNEIDARAMAEAMAQVGGSGSYASGGYGSHSGRDTAITPKDYLP